MGEAAPSGAEDAIGPGWRFRGRWKNEAWLDGAALVVARWRPGHLVSP